MFCKHCGKNIDPKAAVCVTCGAPTGCGERFCANCGCPLQPGAAICMSCGVATKTVVPGAKSKMAAGLLGIFLGAFGVHNFYLGYIGKAVTQLCLSAGSILLTIITCGVAGVITPFIILGASIWGLIEGIMILCGSINTDAQGNLLGD